ncbi:unnamed protein product [Phytophthora fragariaefolia]|uniref:Unnamed protein product n=1 Tax=Phytophthora fragariaefolia TaxID=1490495 RepID=A0A9W6XGP3_9STRA|nr:unnamed protein product [Phytophthora fragariaefolia]
MRSTRNKFSLAGVSRVDWTISSYFEGQWLTGKFAAWQCHHSPVGFAKPNNPVGQFNRVVKQRYTQHRRLRMGLLLQRLLEYFMSESASRKAFKSEVGGNSRFKTWATDVRRNGLVVEAPPSRASIASLVDADVSDVVNVFTRQPPRVFIPARGRTVETITVAAQVGYHTARMEVEGQPETGWRVDITKTNDVISAFSSSTESAYM